jgi:hypothetical protein
MSYSSSGTVNVYYSFGAGTNIIPLPDTYAGKTGSIFFDGTYMKLYIDGVNIYNLLYEGTIGEMSARINVPELDSPPSYTITDIYFSNGLNNNVPCIVEGQHILTQRGYVKVEDLLATDYIITSDNRQVTANVYKFTVEKTTEKTAPITIKANAFAPNSPPNDIRLSPLHAIQRKKGVWDIPIKAMKRYTNVIQDEPGHSVTYYHIETPNFLKDNLVVEGATVEAYGVNYAKKHNLKATDIYRWSSTLKGYTRISNPSISKSK